MIMISSSSNTTNKLFLGLLRCKPTTTRNQTSTILEDRVRHLSQRLIGNQSRNFMSPSTDQPIFGLKNSRLYRGLAKLDSTTTAVATSAILSAVGWCALSQENDDILERISSDASLLRWTSINMLNRISLEQPLPLQNNISKTRCDGLLYTEKDFPSGYSESDRFMEVLRFHRSLLPDYIDRWIVNKKGTMPQITWPKNVPTSKDIESLQMDYNFCRRSPNYRNMTPNCQDLQFRIACYWLSSHDDEKKQKGFQLVKDLAERGHADGMCYYGILLNQGKIEGVEAKPEEAVVWWRRCVDYHRHIWASYELGVAFYTGDGVAENVALASKFFRQAAHFGHAGAAYVLGDMLLNGMGVERDRATALEWLVTAAELGHPLAQERVIIVIQQEYEALEQGLGLPDTRDETLKWMSNPDAQPAREVLIERRYTIGGGTRNPVVMKRRKTVVEESVKGRKSREAGS